MNKHEIKNNWHEYSIKDINASSSFIDDQPMFNCIEVYQFVKKYNLPIDFKFI